MRPLIRFFTVLSVASLVALSACTKGTGKRENVLRYPLPSEPPTLDWSKLTDGVSISVVFQLHEGLTKQDKDLNIVPALAEKWDISKDGKTYTFHLRDTKWSDGVPIKASDFIYSWQRLLDPKTAAEYAYFLFDLENAQEFNSGKVTDFSQVGVKAPDEKTLVVKLTHPASYFLHVPAFAVTYPHRKDVIDAQGTRFIEPPNLRSAGPYRLSEWKHDSKLVLEPNPYYYGNKPAIAKVILYVVKEDSTTLSMYERNELDVALRIPSLELDRVKTWKDYHSTPYLRGYYYGFNVEKKPFDNANVRKAFAHAINRNDIVSVLKAGKLPTTSWVPKGMFGYNPKVGLDYNPALAKQYLAKAGYPGGKGFPAVSLYYDSLEMHKLVAEKLQFMWKTVLGIEGLELATQEWKVYLDTVTHNTPALFRLGWGADYPDPHNFLDLFTSVSGNNNTHWKSKPYDALIAKGAASLNPKDRQTTYDKAQKMLLEDETVIIPLFQESHEIAVKPWVQNFVIDAMEYPRISDAKIQPEDKPLGE